MLFGHNFCLLLGSMKFLDIIIIIVGSCIALMSVRFDPPGAPDYYPGFSTAAIRRSSISRNKFLPGIHLLHLGGVWQM